MEVDLYLRVHRLEESADLLDEVLLSLDGAEIVFPISLGDVEGDRAHGIPDGVIPIPSGFQILIGILRVLEVDDPDVDILVDRILKALECRLDSGIVLIEAEVDHPRQPFKELDLLLCQGGSADCDRVGESCLVECEDVHLSFHDHDVSPLGDILLCEMEAVEDGALVEDLRRRGVEVFREARIKHPSCEGHDIPGVIVDREGDPPEELIFEWGNEDS